jgi:hypothetical protein
MELGWFQKMLRVVQSLVWFAGGGGKKTVMLNGAAARVFSNPKMSLKEAKGRRSGFCPFGI